MAIYKQNTKDKIGTTEQVTRLFLEDIKNFGINQHNLYLQDEAIVIKILLATYHMDDPDLTVGQYLTAVSEKKMPSIIAITRAIYRAMDSNLPKYKEARKLALESIQSLRPDVTKIELLVNQYNIDKNRTDLIVQYYIENYAITRNSRVVDWLDLTAQTDVPSLVFIDLSIMRKLNKDKKSIDED